MDDLVQPETVLCEICDDSGWWIKECEGRQNVICGRRRVHLPHTFAVPCYCRPVNRNYQARLESNRSVA